MTNEELRRVITDLNNSTNKLIADSLAYAHINERISDAHSYCQGNIMTQAWGKNIWHAILDDTIELRKEINKMKEKK